MEKGGSDTFLTDLNVNVREITVTILEKMLRKQKILQYARNLNIYPFKG